MDGSQCLPRSRLVHFSEFCGYDCGKLIASLFLHNSSSVKEESYQLQVLPAVTLLIVSEGQRSQFKTAVCPNTFSFHLTDYFERSLEGVFFYLCSGFSSAIHVADTMGLVQCIDLTERGGLCWIAVFTHNL